MRAFLACLLVFACVLALSAKADGWSAPYLGLFMGYGDANDAWDEGGAPGDPRISPEYRHTDYGSADVQLRAASGDLNLETDEVRARISVALD